MKTLITMTIMSVFLAGCATAPDLVPSKITSFPTPPASLMVAPAPLKTIKTDAELNGITVTDTSPSDVKLSDVLKSVTDNYTLSNKFREQILGLQEWIAEQKKIYP